MRRSDVLRIMLALALGAVLSWGGTGLGCNPSLIQSLGGEANVPTAPGENPYILLRLINGIAVPPSVSGTIPIPSGVGYLATWRYAGGQRDAWAIGGSGLAVTEDFGRLVNCNMTVITIGDIDDLTVTGTWLLYGGNVVQPLKPFGKILQNGVDFRCGDVLTFITYYDPSSPRNYAVDYQVQSGQGVTGPFTGPNTFTNYDQEADAWAAGLPYP
jgi:hypothetical protein